jgi:ribosomal-protein-serine acetyltransferase
VDDVFIRPFRLTDTAALYEAVLESADALKPWMPWCHAEYKTSDAREWIDTQIDAFERGYQYQFAIVSEKQEILGVCGLNGIQPENRLANLGYWVRTSACGRGIATKAARLVAQWAFANTDLDRLEIVIAVGNLGSLRVAAKIGAVWEGLLRGRIRLNDQPRDAILFSIMRGDLRDRGAGEGN